MAPFARNITNEVNLRGAIDFNNLTGFVNEPRIVGISISAKRQSERPARPSRRADCPKDCHRPAMLPVRAGSMVRFEGLPLHHTMR